MHPRRFLALPCCNGAGFMLGRPDENEPGLVPLVAAKQMLLPFML